MGNIVHNIRQLNAEHNILPRGTTIIVGVSGGADSLCLLHALHTLRAELGITLHAATLDHALRGDDAATDTAFVAETARAWSIPVTVARRDVAAQAAAHGLGIEEAARQARYTFLAQVAAREGASRIAVAHNADDQSETVLMHFLRGSGLGGLRGMQIATSLGDYHLLPDTDLDPARFTLLRPLLNTPRADIEAYCAAHGLTPRFDRSNLDTTYFRNRLRHAVIPYLETLNPNLRALLRRTASVLAADYDALHTLHIQRWAEVCRAVSPTAVVFDRAAWRALSLSAQRATLRMAAQRLNHTLRDLSFAHIEGAVRAAARGDVGTQATLPGKLALRVEYDTLIVASDAHTPTPPPWPLIWGKAALVVRQGATLRLPQSTWRFSLTPGHALPDVRADMWRAALAIPPDAEIILRGRRPGDRFAPQGMGGHTQKLADFMINAKIPALWRRHIPLLVVDGQIAWVAGWRVSHYFVVPNDMHVFTVARFIDNG